MPDLCTGCMECALACPDAAIPNTVHDINDLLITAVRQLDIAEAQREALRDLVHPLADAVARSLSARQVAQAVPRDRRRRGGRPLESTTSSLRGNLRKLANALVAFPVAKTRPFFDAAESATPGSGGLFSAVIDPWKCTGCLECVDVCGPHALVERQQDPELLDMLQARFEFLEPHAEHPGALRRRRDRPGWRHQAADARSP